MAQAHEARQRLAAALGWHEDAIEIVPVTASGDKIQDRPLAEIGGKALWTKELDAWLLSGEIDFAVHSAKDMPTAFPDPIIIAGYLPREDVRDALIATGPGDLAGLRHGAVVGTASLRRQALVRRLRPDITTGLLRGTVETRLRKVQEGEFDATLLALAGLNRLDGSCRTPIAGHAKLDGSTLRFSGLVLRVDGSESYGAERSGTAADAARMGEDAGRDILGRAPADILAH